MLADLRLALRSLGRARGFTAVAVVTLALGIGLNAAVFGVVDAVLLRPLPFSDAGALVHLWEEEGSQPLDSRAGVGQSSLRDLVDWRARTHSFASLAAYRYWLFNVVGGPRADAVLGAYVSSELFPTLRARAAIGRTFLPGEDRPGGPALVVISDGLWRRRFGADPRLVGRTIDVDGGPHTVVGVMPASFEFPNTIPSSAVLPSRALDVWLPLAEDPYTTGRGQHNWWVLGRLRAGVSPADADAEMRRVGTEQHAAYPEAAAVVRAAGLRERVVAPLRSSILLLLGAVALVLLIACANVANLLLARGSARSREFAVRAALGAGRGRIVRQLLAESLVLALAGGALGVLVAQWGLAAAIHAAPDALPRVGESRIDDRVVLFAFAASVVTSLVFGLLPALQIAHGSLAGSLRAGGGRGATAGRSASRSRAALVVAEVALSLVLLASAGLLLRSYREVRHVALGFSPEHVLTMQTLLPAARYPTPASQAAYYRRAIARLDRMPGVEDAAVVNVLPLSGLGSGNSIEVEGRPKLAPDKRPEANFRTISDRYFRTMRIPVRAGRVFTAADTLGAPLVAVVSEALVARIFPNENPIGHRLTGFGDPAEIVGVVGDVQDDALDAPPLITVYVPVEQQADVMTGFVVRVAGDPAAAAAGAQTAMADVDPAQPVMNVRPMDSFREAVVAARRFTLGLLAAFAAAAFLLAAVGLYGVVAFVAATRTHEMGVRVALGARRADLLRLVVGGGMRMAVGGVLVGVVGALAAARLLRAQLYGVGTADPLTFASVAVGLLGVAFVASYVPARRAARVDPVTAMRAE